jgi:hypothetical protein
VKPKRPKKLVKAKRAENVGHLQLQGRERERDMFFYAQRPKRFMQKPLHERSYEDLSQTMEIDMVNFLKQYRDLMVKVKGVVVVVVILIVVVVVVVVVVRSLFRLYIVTSYEFNCNICRMS